MGLSTRHFQDICVAWNFKQQDEWEANREHPADMKSELF
jgi:hypothetical protein